MKKIDIKQEAYFPFTFKLFSLILFAFGLLIWTQREWHFMAKLLIMIASYGLGSSIFTARYGLTIDPIGKSIHEYTQILFWKTGKVKPYDIIEKIFINEVTESSRFQTRTGTVHDVKNKAYKAFIKLNNDDKIQLDRDKTRGRLEDRVRNYRELLGVPE